MDPLQKEIKRLWQDGPKRVCEYVRGVIGRYERKNKELLRENKELKELLAKDSHNSGLPPSSDRGKQKNREKKDGEKKDGEKKTGGKPKNGDKPKRNPGGQPGREGSCLQPDENPDQIINHVLQGFCSCGANLDEAIPESEERRQVIEIEFSQTVTEHTAAARTCRCGLRHAAPFPEGVTERVQYGNTVKAFFLHMMDWHHIPYKRATELFRELFKREISPGSLYNWRKDFYEKLAPVEEACKEQISRSQVVHFDETGINVNGKLRCIHVAATSKLTLLVPHEKRGLDAMNEIGILPRFSGVAVHDFARSYFRYDCGHALCNAHLLRELIFLFEENYQIWAACLIELLVEIKEKAEELREQGAPEFPPHQLRKFEKEYDVYVFQGEAENPHAEKEPGKNGGTKQTKERNLLDRLKNRKRQILAFMYDLNVPFDNNQAERDLRPAKLFQKISGYFRSFEGLQYRCRIRSYISTARKHDQPILQTIQDALDGRPFIPQLEYG